MLIFIPLFVGWYLLLRICFMLTYVETYWYCCYLLIFVDLCRWLLIFVDLCWSLLVFVDLCWYLLIFDGGLMMPGGLVQYVYSMVFNVVSVLLLIYFLIVVIICCHLLQFVDICWLLLVFVDICCYLYEKLSVSIVLCMSPIFWYYFRRLQLCWYKFVNIFDDVCSIVFNVVSILLVAVVAICS